MSTERYFIQRVYEYLRGYRIPPHLRTYERVEGWSDAELKEYQSVSLNQQLNYCFAEIPYYRNLSKQNPLLRTDIPPEEKLNFLPVLSKSDLQDSSLFMPETIPPGTFRNHTGGSTGEVFNFYQDREYLNASFAAQRYFNTWIGWKPGERLASIWGASIENSTHKRLINRIIQKIYNQLFVSTYNLDRIRIREKLSLLQQFMPVLLTGYPTSLSEFALMALDSQMSFPGIKGIITSAETLFPDQRKQISRVFRAPVYNRYGSRECSLMAQECSVGSGLHLDQYRYWFEFLEVEPGLSEIVVTQFFNKAMPLVRYRTGDLARISDEENVSCPCGHPFGRIAHVEGRRFDLIRGEAGEVITGTFWTLLLRTQPGVNSFQVHQKALNQILISLVVDDRYQKDVSESYYRKHIAEQFKNTVQIKFNYPEEIKPLPSGKHRFVISDVGPKMGIRQS